MDTLLIWGTGGNAAEFIVKLDPEKAKIAAFVDNDRNKQGQTFQGFDVVSPAKISEIEFDRIIVCSVYFEEIFEQLRGLSIDMDKVSSERVNTPSLMKKYGKKNPYMDLGEEGIRMLESVTWYHKFEIIPGMENTGRQKWHPEKLNYFEAGDNAQGKSVLDIGAWDGPYTFEMERRGAVVTSFDIQDPNRSGFYAAQGINGSKAKYIRGSVYDLTPEAHGTYDIVLFLGVYYHLQSPVQAFHNIYSVLNPGGLMVFEGAILEGAPHVDEFWKNNTGLLEAVINTPFCWYSKGKYQNDWSNWSVPTAVCLHDWIESAGFDVLALDKRERDSRAYGAARKIDDFNFMEHDIQ